MNDWHNGKPAIHHPAPRCETTWCRSSNDSDDSLHRRSFRKEMINYGQTLLTYATASWSMFSMMSWLINSNQKFYRNYGLNRFQRESKRISLMRTMSFSWHALPLPIHSFCTRTRRRRSKERRTKRYSPISYHKSVGMPWIQINFRWLVPFDFSLISKTRSIASMKSLILAVRSLLEWPFTARRSIFFPWIIVSSSQSSRSSPARYRRWIPAAVDWISIAWLDPDSVSPSPLRLAQRNSMWNLIDNQATIRFHLECRSKARWLLVIIVDIRILFSHGSIQW